MTLGEMLTAAHRGQVDHCVPGGMSVSQSTSSVMFDGSGQPDGERMVDRSGKPDERNSSNAQIRILLEEQRQTIIAEYREKSVIRNSMQLTQKKSADSYKDNYGDRNWNFLKLIGKVLQKWKKNGNSRVLPSIRSRDENLWRIRTLFFPRSERDSVYQSDKTGATYTRTPVCASRRQPDMDERSTSYAAGVSPSAPTARGSSRSERATARATAHAISEPHRMHHACSARRRSSQGSCRALALAS